MSRSFLSSMDMYEREIKVKKFVLFKVDENLFGVPVEQVGQVDDFNQVFDVPGSPDYVLGVMNLRGKIVTLINLKKRLNLEEASTRPETKEKQQVIFVEVADQILGMLVDKIISLRAIPLENIKDELDLISTKVDMAFLKGAAFLDDDIVILLNLDQILSEYEVEELIQHREKLEAALQKKEKVVLPEEKLMELNLEDDFSVAAEEKSEKSNKGRNKKR